MARSPRQKPHRLDGPPQPLARSRPARQTRRSRRACRRRFCPKSQPSRRSLAPRPRLRKSRLRPAPARSVPPPDRPTNARPTRLPRHVATPPARRHVPHRARPRRPPRAHLRPALARRRCHRIHATPLIPPPRRRRDRQLANLRHDRRRLRRRRVARRHAPLDSHGSRHHAKNHRPPRRQRRPRHQILPRLAATLLRKRPDRLGEKRRTRPPLEVACGLPKRSGASPSADSPLPSVRAAFLYRRHRADRVHSLHVKQPQKIPHGINGRAPFVISY